MNRFFQVKNFERFQHYKDRSPPWIKLYNELLDDYKFARLPDASKAHLLAIWLLASRHENKIPYDPEWIARRINATSPVDLDALAAADFIIPDQERSKTLARRKRNACPEREGETEREQSREEIRAVAKATRPAVDEKFDEFWKVYPKRDGANPKEPARKLFLLACKAGEDPDRIIAGARGYGRECDRLKITGTDKVAQALTWLRQLRWSDYVDAGADEGPTDPEQIKFMASKGYAWSTGERQWVLKPPDASCEAPAAA